VSGAAGKLRRIVPDEFDKARTRSWSSSCHFLLVDIADDVMTVRAIGELGTSPTLIDIARLDPGGVPVTEPMVIALVG
jgi:hypothetical protein